MTSQSPQRVREILQAEGHAVRDEHKTVVISSVVETLFLGLHVSAERHHNQVPYSSLRAHAYQYPLHFQITLVGGFESDQISFEAV
jgi:hypothetical protein